MAATAATFAIPVASKLDAVLREGIKKRRIPAVSAAVATPMETIYAGAFGVRDSASQKPIGKDAIFGIASMTKAITTVAAMQLIERGKLSLDDPMGKYLPDFVKPQVLTGFGADGKPQLRPATKTVTVRHLLTHTSGFAYDNWDADMLRYQGRGAPRPAVPPLMREPGTRWEYGTSLDWVGQIVEVVSRMSLEAYFQQNILQPLGMRDTTYVLTAEKFPRKVSNWRRQPDGVLKEDPYVLLPPPKAFNGGGGLYSTPSDYVRFMQTMLRHGGKGILEPRSVELMSTNQIGSLSAGKMKAARPENTSDVDFHPGEEDKFTFGFLMNPKAYAKGRSAGSLAWAGMANCFYWIDPQRSLCAALMMQYLPFCDREAIGLLRDFEEAVYSGA